MPDPDSEPPIIAKHGLNPTDVALKKFGKKIVANMVLLGYMNTLLNLVSDNSLADAVSRSVPSGTQDLNLRRCGREWRWPARSVAPNRVRSPDAGEQDSATL